ncbi:hypothetical protein E1267_21155 [Nonomuraea longispora]|uniref:Uncharacterized protein n=1 Tax=Nonomuraea longispora TaxID=1848320 RepID=A0A4R4NDY6_9ACTN|nr:hypothetical protein [Nonomuraea longispora]TDC04922.1 hypothetical protein E1267_21155 [Nonomuraea longispora]
MTDDFPDLPDFDPKATRNAVRRGVLRTAAIVLTVLVLLAAALTWGSAAVQTRGDREQRMAAVLGTAFKMYSPAYAVSLGACCETTPMSMSLEVQAAPLRPAGDFWPAGGAAYTISQNLFGRVGRLPLGSVANTRLSTALYDVGTSLAPKKDVRKVLDRLPGDLRAMAVVEFATPLPEGDMKAFMKTHGACAERVAYERRPGALSITWGFGYWADARTNPGKKGGDMTEESCGGGLRDFRAWVGLLHEHDDANLRAFDLSLDRLRRAADGGLSYAYVDQGSSVEKLREVIKDPRVRTVRLADVAFDLDKP